MTTENNNMTTEIDTTGGTALASYASAANRFAQVAGNMGASEGAFMKFDGNSGTFSFGTDQEELEHGTHLAANIAEVSRGHICWVDGEVKEEVMGSILAGDPPNQGSLHDYGPYQTYPDGTKDGWSEQVVLTFRNPEDGEKYTFKTTSKSGLRAVANLIRDYGKLFKTHPNDTPVVELGANSFVPKNNKKVGKKYAPDFKITAWLTPAEIEKMADAAQAAADDAEEDGASNASNYEAPAKTPDTSEAAETAADPASSTGRRAKRF